MINILIIGCYNIGRLKFPSVFSHEIHCVNHAIEPDLLSVFINQHIVISITQKASVKVPEINFYS